MELSDLKLPSARDEFATELQKYYNKEPYDAGHIIEYMAVAFAQYRASSTTHQTEMDFVFAYGLKPIVEYVNHAERAESMYKASYVAASAFRAEAEKSLGFWKTTSTVLAVIPVTWAVVRSLYYLWPAIEPHLTRALAPL